MAQFIKQYQNRITSCLDIDKRAKAFSSAIDLIFTSITDRHNLNKIDRQTKTVEWAELNDQSIVQTFRFNIENIRNNYGQAKKALTSAVKSSNSAYEKALIASSISWQASQENRHLISLSTAQRSLGLLNKDNSLRSTLLKIQVIGHKVNTFQKLGLVRMEQSQRSKMITLIKGCRAIYPAQKFIGCTLSETKEELRSLSNIRKLISIQIGSLSNKWPYQRSRIVRSLFVLNELAIKCRDFQKSKFALKMIQNILPIKNQRALSGYYYRDLAKLAFYSAKDQNHNPAFTDQLLSKAESIFGSLGSKGRHGITTTLLIKGEFLLERRKYDSAMKCIKRSLSLSQLLKDNKLFTYSVLLSSFFLLTPGVKNKSALYEDTLLKTQKIGHPILLFRVLSNLYLYSWGASRLDESCLIINKIHSLKPVLPALTFKHLWKTYLADIVFSQFSKNLPGTDIYPPRLC